MYWNDKELQKVVVEDMQEVDSDIGVGVVDTLEDQNIVMQAYKCEIFVKKGVEVVEEDIVVEVHIEAVEEDIVVEVHIEVEELVEGDTFEAVEAYRYLYVVKVLQGEHMVVEVGKEGFDMDLEAYMCQNDGILHCYIHLDFVLLHQEDKEIETTIISHHFYIYILYNKSFK